MLTESFKLSRRDPVIIVTSSFFAGEPLLSKHRSLGTSLAV